jgi:hypothetical protein
MHRVMPGIVVFVGDKDYSFLLKKLNGFAFSVKQHNNPKQLCHV